jgi:hypothetical protein
MHHRNANRPICYSLNEISICDAVKKDKNNNTMRENVQGRKEVG